MSYPGTAYLFCSFLKTLSIVSEEGFKAFCVSVAGLGLALRAVISVTVTTVVALLGKRQ